MPDIERNADIVEKIEILDRAEKLKKKRFTRNGLFLILLSLVFIGIGLYLNTGAQSSEGFFVGVGVIILISGIVSLLIGVINPFLSDEVRRNRNR